MMELDRLKELKLQEERETARKIQNREGSLVIIDQIKDRERKMKKYKELIEKERQERRTTTKRNYGKNGTFFNHRSKMVN